MPYVLYSELNSKYWKVCRSTLHNMRKEDQLIEGAHYIFSRNKIYWNTEIIEHGLANGFDSFSHLQKCQQFRKKVS